MISDIEKRMEELKDELTEYVAYKTPYKKEDVEIYIIHTMSLVHEDRLKEFIDKELIFILSFFSNNNNRFIIESIRVRSNFYKLSKGENNC